MANGTTHAIAGGVTGLGVALYDRLDVAENGYTPVLATTVGVVFAKLPDILEPALNPHHRQFCHIAVLAALGYGVKKIYEWQPEDKIEAFFRIVLLSAGAGYISHLLLDATTSRSIPLLGKI